MKHIFFLLFAGSLFFAACKKDVAIGPPIDIEADYTLPQGDAPKEANDKIQQLYDTYGSYFLYNFTQKDFEWAQSTSTGNSKIDTAVLGDPQYTGDMLAMLDEVWLKFLPENFKKAGGIPYRVFIMDSIRQYRGPGYPPGMEYLNYEFKITGQSVAFSGMNAGLRTMTPEQKLAKKNVIIVAMWNYYIANRYLDIPEEFYNVSNYTVKPAMPVNAANPDNVEAYRQKGFLPRSYNTVTGSPFEWLTNDYAWNNSGKSNDLNSFVFHLLQRTDEEMAPYVDNYPLIKQKFDILVNHFMNKYQLDVRAIANATY
jgi:hypothetical protein